MVKRGEALRKKGWKASLSYGQGTIFFFKAWGPTVIGCPWRFCVFLKNIYLVCARS